MRWHITRLLPVIVLSSAACGIAGLSAVADALPVNPAGPPNCQAPALPGAAVDVTLTDQGPMMGPGMMGPGMMGPGMMGPGMMGPGMMGPGQNGQWPHMGPMAAMGMMRVVVNRSTVPAGQVSLRVINAGTLSHEIVVLPLAAGQSAGRRSIGPDGTVDEAGSLGEASRTCGANAGEQSADPGIAPGATGWTTVDLRPGRYELVCNLAGHYGAGMYTELTVT